MVKGQLERKMHFNLKLLDITKCKISDFSHNYKKIKKMTDPEWPKLLELGSKTQLILNMAQCRLEDNDIETIAFMLGGGANTEGNAYSHGYGESKLTHLMLSRNSVQCNGARHLA